MLIRDFGCIWAYEGIAYYAFGARLDGNLKPVYRFWSGQSHFYTISEQEKDTLIRDSPNVWTYEAIAFYAYPEGVQPEVSQPVYRFWSANLGKHFDTISEQRSRRS